MEYLVRITDNSIQAKNIINLLKSLAEDYDFLEIVDKKEATLGLSKEQQTELERRLKYSMANPSEGITWDEMEKSWGDEEEV